TELGDPIEVRALAEAFDALAPGQVQERCWLGSVKSNVGHTESAAGLVGLIKVLLAFQHGILPKTAHFHRPNPRIPLDGSPFHVLSENTRWPPGSLHPRRAGVSLFGFGGVNAHVVLEEAPPSIRAR